MSTTLATPRCTLRLPARPSAPCIVTEAPARQPVAPAPATEPTLSPVEPVAPATPVLVPSLEERAALLEPTWAKLREIVPQLFDLGKRPAPVTQKHIARLVAAGLHKPVVRAVAERFEKYSRRTPDQRHPGWALLLKALPSGRQQAAHEADVGNAADGRGEDIKPPSTDGRPPMTAP
jgi:hypothetical protein